MKEFSLKIRVYYEDTDAEGVVYYGNYFKFIERGRTEMFRKIGLNQSQMGREDVYFVVHSLSSNFISSAKLDDEIEVRTIISELDLTSLTFKQNIIFGDRKIFNATVKIVCVKKENGVFKPIKIPTFITEKV